MLLSNQSNALVIITSDFNRHTTGFKSKDLPQADHLKQLVAFKTRDSGTLNRFFTNKPKLFIVSQSPMVKSSDHYIILARPMLSPEHKTGHQENRVTRYARQCMACAGDAE